MLPDEIAALRRAEARAGGLRILLALLVLLAAALPTLLFAIFEEGGAAHLLGRSEQVQARVEAVTLEGVCNRSSTDRHRVEVTWTAEGALHHDDYTTCGNAPAPGDVIDIWVVPSGYVATSGPTAARLGLGGFGVILGGLVAWLGFGLQVQAARRRRRLLAADTASLGPAEPVELVLTRRTGLAVVAAGSPAGPGRRHPPQAGLVLYSRAGVPSRRPTSRKLAGTWWLRLAPATDPRALTGLVTRGQERCWVDIPRPR